MIGVQGCCEWQLVMTIVPLAVGLYSCFEQEEWCCEESTWPFEVDQSPIIYLFKEKNSQCSSYPDTRQNNTIIIKTQQTAPPQPLSHLNYNHDQ